MSSHQVDRQAWAQLSLNEQMGNIGSEVGRAIKAKRAGKDDRMQGAIDRALDLFDATTETLVAQKSYRTREILRAREEFLRLFYDNTFDADADRIEQYFMWLAWAAGNARTR